MVVIQFTGNERKFIYKMGMSKLLIGALPSKYYNL